MGRSRSKVRRRPRSNPHGVLAVHGGRFGFVRTAEGEYFVPESKMAGAFDGDLVEVAPLPAREGGKKKGVRTSDAHSGARDADRPAARVVRVLDRAHDTVVGRYEVAEPFGVVVPEDARIPYDIFTMRADNPEIEDGALVRVRISAFPSRYEAATGVVEEVLGRADGGGAVSVEAVIARHKLETAFCDEALSEAAAARLDVPGALADGYRDLRGRLVFTVDPADARDFDDALSLERVTDGEAVAGFSMFDGPFPEASSRSDSPGSHETSTGSPARAETVFVDSSPDCPPCGTRLVDTSGDGPVVDGGCEKESSADVHLTGRRGLRAARWRLGVHIADVSHYVPWNSSLDLDARRRATSVYLVDRVIPMLPEALSNGLCSLNPHEARRAMTCDLYLDERAEVVGYSLYPSIIESDARLSYDEAQAALDAADAEDAPAGAGVPEGVAARLRGLSAIAKRRAARREAAGGLDFDFPEAKVRLDAEGQPVGIALRRKTDATSLVEEAMILANETVAAHLAAAKFPGIFRVHEKPSPDSLAALIPVLQEFPWFRDVSPERLVAGDAHTVQQVLSDAAGRPEAELVSSLVLRAMKRAVYRPACEGHYGLASEVYAHFTSPIRRYPDLVVHRMLRAALTRRPQRFDQEAAALPWIAEHASDMERVAEKAARESQEIKMVEYMAAFVGQAFSAVVSGVATYGAYVRLENTVEGIVPARELGPEYFALDMVRHTLTGQDSGTAFRLGQRVAVVLEAADVRACRLEFRLA